MRISEMSVGRERFKTAEPKGPVPPVIMRVLFLNRDILILLTGVESFDTYIVICLPLFLQINLHFIW